MRRALTAAGVATVLIAAGCTSSTHTPTNTQAPTRPGSSVLSTTTRTTPSPSASRTSATAYESPDPTKVAEAEQVFRDFQTAFFAAQVRGGSATLPPDIAAVTAQPIAANVQQVLAQQITNHEPSPAPTPEPRVVFSGPIKSSHEGSELTLSVCVDGTKTPMLTNGKRTSFGVAVSYDAYFKTFSGALKLFYAENERVKSC